MSAFDLALAMIAPVLQLALAIILFRRKLHRQFPLFFAYTLYSLLAIVVRISVTKYPSTYFVIYWITDIISNILALLVIREVFLPSLEGFPEKYRWVRWILPVAVIGIVALAFWNAFYHPVGYGPLVSLAAGAYSFEISMRWLELTVFIVAAILDRTGHLALLLSETAILAGFGLAALLTLAADLSRAKFGVRFEEAFRYLPTTAYIGAAGIWLIGFLYKERKPRFRLSDEQLSAMEAMLKRQQETLDKLRGKDQSPSLGSVSPL